MPFSEASQAFGTWGFTGGILQDLTIAAEAGEVFLSGRDFGNRIWWYDRASATWFFAGGQGLSSGGLQGAK